ncbi:transferase [Dokdonia sinensis]|uniref:Transferase n=1 Tax=Dokdonia sinensis TaxID=2479847 RepID=A0A3M0FY88_9FLAO|nr:transferase [Dokdonia sinensis]RMB57448.1 transferase [Dokdonia sinensis]
MSTILNPIRKLRNRWRRFWAINWYKTYYFNFKKLPFSEARKLPFFFYGPVRFTNISGTIFVDAPLQKGMVRIGYNYEKDTVRRSAVELNILGSLIFKGRAQLGKDIFVYVGSKGQCILGDMIGIASRSHLVVENSITLGNWTRISAECQIYDTDFHRMIDKETNNAHPLVGSVHIGNNNFIGYRCSIKKGTVTLDFCTVAPMSLTNKNYSEHGENILIGGVPAKLLKENISRDWENEYARMERTAKA